MCLAIIFALFLSGCSSDVSKVKNGTMPGYEKTTIGKAFEASFDDVKWEAFEGKKGERVVQFTGKISKDLHNTALAIAKKGIAGDFEAIRQLHWMPGKQKFIESLKNKYGCILVSGGGIYKLFL